jgi:N-carbamoyl-D-amino-acid hydrolase
MTRIVTVGAAQLGPIARTETRASAVARMIALLRQGASHGCDLVVFPECALTAFFPHWFYERQDDIDAYFERAMPNAATQPLFGCARELGIGFYLGFAELAIEDGAAHRFNASILVDKAGCILGKYRKVHLPGHSAHEPWRPFQNLEKRYFEVGNLGFPVFRAFGGIVGMAICNDRRWPETYRVMGLQGVEMVLLGYNTPSVNAEKIEEGPEKRLFHNRLSVQSGAYQNATWVVAVAKAGVEDGFPLIGGSLIVDPDGEIVAEACTEGDELLLHPCDLDATIFGKKTIFNFARHRRIEHYGLITSRTGAVPPPET